MKFWWVNQNKTFKQEILGGYLWCPTKTKAQRTNRYYEYIKDLSPGDIVFSFVKTRIHAVGVVQDYYYESKQPQEFGETGELWEQDGWCIPVKFFEIQKEKRIRLKDHINSLRSYLNVEDAPLHADNGNGKEFYLTKVSKELAEQIEKLIQINLLEVRVNFIDSDPFLDMLERTEEEKIQNSSLDETTKRALVDSRRGQGKFKRNVAEVLSQCVITGLKDKNFLIASHIKPWVKSNNIERLDGNNGLLLAPHIDQLFDRGYISFNKEGYLILNPKLPQQVIEAYELEKCQKHYIFNHKQHEYLQYHREVIFEKRMK